MIENLRAIFQTFQKDPEMICKIFNRKLVNPIRAFLDGKPAEEIREYREGKKLIPDDEQDIYNIDVNYLEGNIHICKFNKLTFLYDKKNGRTGLYMNYPAGFLSKAVWDDDGNFEPVVLTGMHPSEKKFQKIVLDWFEKSREAEEEKIEALALKTQQDKKTIEENFENIIRNLQKTKRLSEDSVNVWLKPLTLKHIWGPYLLFSMKDDSDYELLYMIKKYLRALEKSILAVTGLSYQIRIHSETMLEAVENGEYPEKYFDEIELHKQADEDSSNLNPKLTFEHFAIAPFNAEAYGLTRDAVITPGTSNPLLIVSKEATGKTHLLNATGNMARTEHPRATVIYTTGEDLHGELIYLSLTKDEESKKRVEAQLYNKYVEADFLLIDAIGCIRDKKAQTILSEILARCIAHGGQVILTARWKIAEAQIRGRWLLQNLGVTDTDKHPFLTLDSDFEAFEPDQDYNEEQSQKDPRRNMLTEIKAPGFEDKLIVALKLEELWHNRMKKHELVYLLKNTDISISALRGYLHKNRYKYSSKHWNVLGEDMPWFSVKDYNRCTDFSFYEQRGNILNSY